jgi:hypothetical protein
MTDKKTMDSIIAAGKEPSKGNLSCTLAIIDGDWIYKNTLYEEGFA